MDHAEDVVTETDDSPWMYYINLEPCDGRGQCCGRRWRRKEERLWTNQEPLPCSSSPPCLLIGEQQQQPPLRLLSSLAEHTRHDNLGGQLNPEPGEPVSQQGVSEEKVFILLNFSECVCVRVPTCSGATDCPWLTSDVNRLANIKLCSCNVHVTPVLRVVTINRLSC